RLTQQGIDLFTPVVRGQVVRGVDVLQRYLLTVDKRKNVDRLGRLGVSGTDFLLTQHHVAPLLVSDALDDIFLGDFLAGDLVHPLVANRLHAALIQPVKIHSFGRAGGNQRNRYVDKTKTDGAFPDGTGHGDRLLKLAMTGVATVALGGPEP